MKCIIFSFLLASLLGCYAHPSEKNGGVKKELPSFKLLLPDSITYFNVDSVSSNKPVVLFFFGDQCPYSRAQIVEIIENIGSMGDIQFFIFTIPPFSTMKSFYEQYQLSRYSNITTGLDYTLFFANYFKAQSVPYIAIYGKDKRLNKIFKQKVSFKEIKEAAKQ